VGYYAKLYWSTCSVLFRPDTADKLRTKHKYKKTFTCFLRTYVQRLIAAPVAVTYNDKIDKGGREKRESYCDEQSVQLKNPTKRPSFFLPTYTIKIKPAKFKNGQERVIVPRYSPYVVFFFL
jgi:hypothetical protein